MTGLIHEDGSNLELSTLSDQLELLRDDLAVNDFNLQLTGEHTQHRTRLIESITAAKLSRTIQGASTVTATVEDRDSVLLQSGVFGETLTLSKHEKTILGQGVAFEHPVDTEIDGLWFRLVNVTQQDPRDRTLTLIFEDREVAVLRGYPKKGSPFYNQVRIVPATVLDRARFMQSLVAEVTEFGKSGIRLVCPMLGEKASTPVTKATQQLDPKTRSLTRHPGFPPKAKFLLKTDTANPTQVDNLQRVLDVGWKLKLADKFLLAALVTVIQENDANLLSSKYLPYVGLFAQNSTLTYWTDLGGGTGNIEGDAGAFFSSAVDREKAFPIETVAELALRTQNPGGSPDQYGQWLPHAQTILALYEGSATVVAGAKPNPHGGTPAGTGGSPYAVPATPFVDLSGSFHQGTLDILSGKRQFVRENHWACLQRLANEVGWRVFMVSGTLYITTDGHLNNAHIAFVASEDQEGIDGIGFSVDTGKAKATLTVACRASRWQAPPGHVAAVEGKGPADGRWLVAMIERSLSDPDTTITLTKPQPSLPDAESANPVVSGTQILTTSGKKKPARTATSRPVVEQDARGVRAAIVDAAKSAYAINWPTYQYDQGRRQQPSSLFPASGTVYADCSSFVALCYKAAGAPDPCGLGYHPLGTTVNLYAHGTKTNDPQPGDVLLYDPDGQLGHAQLYVGDSQVIQMGGRSFKPPGIQLEPINIGDLLTAGFTTGDGARFYGFFTYNLGPVA